MGEAIASESQPTEIGGSSFHQIIRRCSATVGIVTAGDRQNAFGVTCTSFTALSLDPPRLLVNLDGGGAIVNEIARSGVLGLNILNAAQEELASLFSSNDTAAGQRFGGYRWVPGSSQVPLLEYAAAMLECEVEEIIERHFHALIICRVARCRISEDLSGLVYWNDQYHEVSTDEDLVLLADMSGPRLSARA